MKIRKYNEYNSDILKSSDPDEIFNFIESLPNKFKLRTSWITSHTLYNDGITTAITNSVISRFYLEYLKKLNKKTLIIPTPDLSPESYDKLFQLIKICDKLLLSDTIDQSTDLLPLSKQDQSSLNIRLLSANCYQLFNALLYEDYFNIDFRYGNIHQMINDINLPENINEFWEVYKLFNDKKSKIRCCLFFADCLPIPNIIEKYNELF